MKKIIYPIILVLIFATSCKKVDDFLDEPPSKTSALQITSIQHLEQLLNGFSPSSTTPGSATFITEGNRSAAYATDDYLITKSLYDARPATFSLGIIQYALWDVDFLATNATTNITDGNYWTGEFRKIFYANAVLEYLDKVPDGTAEQKANLKAEAHLIRAYSYFQLANTYCLPYIDATKNELGLPIRLTTSFEENAERQTLQKVYELIESDLSEALKTTVPLMQNGKPINWRASKAGANGFAARYWLTRSDYVKALQYVNTALAEYSTLVNYNTEMSFSTITQTYILRPSNTNYTVQFPYMHDKQTITDPSDMLAWKEFLYSRVLSESSWWYVPNPELLNLYDKDNDLRYKYHMVKGYSYSRGLTNPSYDYPGYVFFFKDNVPSGPTVADMLLMKAEALAHQGNVGPAMDALNTLRAKRMTPGAWVNLTATDKDDAIKKVAEERRREMPFATRWYDIRRYNNNEYAGDDVTLTKSFYPYTIAGVTTTAPVQTYTLSKNSRRWAAPIPGQEIIASRDALKQNTY